MFDVTGVRPEAVQIIEAALAVWSSHLGTDLVQAVAHGSAIKGDFIPGGSDLDLDLFVAPMHIDAYGSLPFPLAAAIHRDLAQIDLAPFRYLQGHVYPIGHKPGAGFIPGAYHVIYGDPEVRLATDQELRRNAEAALRGLDAEARSAQTSNRLMEHGEDRLYRELRFLTTNVWPLLYNVVTLRSDDALRSWRLPKAGAIACVDAGTEMGRTIRAFYATLQRHYAAGETVETALAALGQGLAFLQAVERERDRLDGHPRTTTAL